MIVGIDPGQEGGIVAVRRDGSFFQSWLMPATKGIGLNMGPFQAIIRELKGVSRGPLYAFMEKVQPFPGDGVQGLFKYSRDYGRKQGILHCMGVSCLVVPPQTWQKVILGTIPRTPLPDLTGVDKKDVAKIKHKRKLARRRLIKQRGVQVVQERLPELDLTPGRRTKPHDGLSDAGCIALYGWQQMGGIGG